MATPRHDIAEAISHEAAVMFEHGSPLIYDSDREPQPYDLVRTGPQTFVIKTEGHKFQVHVRSIRP